MLKLLRDSAGLPRVDHGTVNLSDGERWVATHYNDLPDDVSQAEIEELQGMGLEARTRSGRPGIATPPPTPTEQTLQEARLRAEIAQLNRDAAIAEAEAAQARIASGHLERQVRRKVEGIRGLQLFWLGFLGWFVGTVAGSTFGAGAGVTVLLGVAGAWLLVWGRLRRVAVEARLLEARAEREAQRRVYEERRAATGAGDQEGQLP